MDDYFVPPKIIPMSHYLTGEASFVALKNAVNEITHLAPEDHDVLIHAYGITVNKIRYFEPHTLLLSGFDDKGNYTRVVIHYSQLVAHVVYLPKRTEKREIIGFSVGGG